MAQESLADIIKAIEQLMNQAKEALDKTDSEATLEAIRVQFYGKKGSLTAYHKRMHQFNEADKKAIGAVLTQARAAIFSGIDARKQWFADQAMQERLKQKIDVTLGPLGQIKGSEHPISMTRARWLAIFKGFGFCSSSGNEIIDEAHNFTALNIPSNHPARSMHDTLYVKTKAGDQLLRTHTSGVQVPFMRQNKPPFRCVSSGRVFRHDELDRSHSPMFYQLEGFAVDAHASFADLKSLLTEALSLFFEQSVKIRFRPSYFPFTEPSAEVDIYDGKSWLEVLGCGMIHPNVLAQGGIDSARYSGYAFGLGLDRLAMLYYGINDLRLFYHNDLRFLSQFSGSK